jgi:hypothetical protein
MNVQRLAQYAGILVLTGVVAGADPPPGVLSLAWDLPPVPSQLEDAWGLYRKREMGSYSLLALLDPTTFRYTDPTVQRNKSYCYTITAIRGSEESPPSNEACARAR